MKLVSLLFFMFCLLASLKANEWPGQQQEVKPKEVVGVTIKKEGVTIKEEGVTIKEEGVTIKEEEIALWTKRTTRKPRGDRTRRTYRTIAQGAAEKFSRAVTPTFAPDITCLLEPGRGPCRADIKMWYYNPKTKDCETFYWGGCQGNGNRFDRKADCLANCPFKKLTNPQKPRFCSIAFDYGWCFGADKRWYYDSLWGVCKETIYSGCGGNKNNFYNKYQCDNVCRFGLPAMSVTNSKPAEAVYPIKIIVVDPTTTKRADAPPPPVPTEPIQPTQQNINQIGG